MNIQELCWTAALLLAVAAGLSYIKYKIKTLLKNAAEKKRGVRWYR